VLLLRDEQANLAWAVERRLTNPLEHVFHAATSVGRGEGSSGFRFDTLVSQGS